MPRPKRQTFVDWSDEEHRPVMEIHDNADSISIELTGMAGSFRVEISARIAPEDLDRFENEIRRIRATRGI